MSKDDFLGRWSKRKLAGQQEKTGDEEIAVTEVLEPVARDVAQEGVSEGDSATLIEGEMGGGEEELEPHPAEGINIEELEYESDFTVFMNDKVPETLRRMALRKLWRSNPILANVDGLNDYDEDFSDAAAVFINSTGKVISGVRDQFLDHEQGDEKSAGVEKETQQPAAREQAEISDSEDIEGADGDIEDTDNRDEVQITARENDPAGDLEENNRKDRQDGEEDSTGTKT